MNEMTTEELAAELRAGTKVILMVRHGERPKMDPDDPSFGDALPLTAEGVRTATELGRRLAEFAGDVRFYASPLRRTMMTAACIAEGMGVAGATIVPEGRVGNDSFYYSNPADVLDVFKPKNFFPACFQYFATGEQRGFKNLQVGTDDLERWLDSVASARLTVVATHDVYIAAFLSARRAVPEFTRENWPRFLDGAAILVGADGSRRYALVRTGLSEGICGVSV